MDVNVISANISPVMSRKVSGSGPRASSGSVQPGGVKVQNVKLVLLGDQGVGKSSIALRFVRGEFTENSEATIGAAFLTQTVNVSGSCIKFDIWDTAGQERYHSLAPMYYRGAQAAAVVYDITNTKTFQRAVQWIKELKQQANSQIIVVLVGNKADMAAEKRAVQRQRNVQCKKNCDGKYGFREVLLIRQIFLDKCAVQRKEAQSFAEENNLIFTESSAKTGMCVGEIFMAVAQTLEKHRPATESEAKGIKLAKDSEKKKDGCC